MTLATGNLRAALLATLLFTLLFTMMAGVGAVPVRATTFFERPFPEIVQDTPVLVRGVIGESRAEWVSQGPQKRIYTYYSLRWSEVFKGRVTQNPLSFRELGGMKDGVGLEISGSARFELGEEVVLLLSPANPDGSHDLRGLMTGKYNLRRGSDGQDYLVGAGVIPPESSEDRRRSSDSHAHEGVEFSGGGAISRKPWSLGELRSLIRESGAGAPPAEIPARVTPRTSERPQIAVTPRDSGVAASSPSTPSPTKGALTASPEPDKRDSTQGIPFGIWLGGLVSLLLMGGAFVFGRKGRSNSGSGRSGPGSR
jgi:hypothetical protein